MAKSELNRQAIVEGQKDLNNMTAAQMQEMAKYLNEGGQYTGDMVLMLGDARVTGHLEPDAYDDLVDIVSRWETASMVERMVCITFQSIYLDHCDKVHGGLTSTPAAGRQSHDGW
jgi:hypothetical protein